MLLLLSHPLFHLFLHLLCLLFHLFVRFLYLLFYLLLCLLCLFFYILLCLLYLLFRLLLCLLRSPTSHQANRSDERGTEEDSKFPSHGSPFLHITGISVASPLSEHPTPPGNLPPLLFLRESALLLSLAHISAALPL